jgi:predicted PhzF superfamily epimerase YddE/YHI9
MDTRADKPDVVCQYRYLHYDVFTDRPLTGNQLAVFTDRPGSRRTTWPESRAR